MILFDKSFKEILDISGADEEVIELQKKDNIKKLTDDSIDLITDINKIYSAKNGEDLFKITTALLKSIRIISTPINTRREFKTFIDSLYKTFYEGSGALKRIPKNRLANKSVFLDIKHLRTDCYHDYEHGKKTDVRKKKKIIAGIYRDYTTKSALEEIEETALLQFQREILENIKKFLLDIKEEIS